MNRIFYLPFCLFLLFSAFSCSRTGCNNVRAENYEPKAKRDCHCCYFAGQIDIWCETQPSAANNSISVYIDGQLVRENISASTIFSIRPESSFAQIPYLLDDSIFLVELGSEEKKVINLRLVNQLGKLVFSDTVTVNASYLRLVKVKL